jgi:tight adherence protein B
MSNGQTLFMVLIFATVFLLAQGLVVPVFGESAQAAKRLKKRLAAISSQSDDESYSSLLRKRYLKQLRPPERFLEQLPAMESLAMTIEQAGYSIMAYRLVLLSLTFGAAAGYLSWAAFRMPLVTVIAAIVAVSLPVLKVRRARAQRLAKFEEQLPDAIDVMKRTGIWADLQRDQLRQRRAARVARIVVAGTERHSDGAGDIHHGAERDRR